MAKKITKTAIAVVEKLLKTNTPEQIINGQHDLHRPLMCALYKSNSCAVIASLFTDAGFQMTRQEVHRLVAAHSMKEVIIREPYNLKPNLNESEILRLFNNGDRITAIAKQLKCSSTTINKVLEQNNASLKDRMLANRVIKIGDRFGNWDVIGHVDSRRSLCRDVRNNVEKSVANQALKNGTSTGCKELRKRVEGI